VAFFCIAALSIVIRYTALLKRRLSRADSALAAAHRLGAAGRLAHGLAHAMKNRLQVVQGYAELAAEGVGRARSVQGPPDEKTVAHLREADQQARQAIGELRAFLEQAGTGGEGRGPIPLGALLDELLAPLRPLIRERSIRLTEAGFAAGDPPSTIVAVRAQTLQILLELILNALDFARSEIRLSVRDVGSTIEISVEDDGPGVEAKVREKLFRGPVSARVGGTGLGLWLAHQAAAELRGSLRLDEGAKARFSLRLPKA
jgi:two-component system C4-dicarboxylate transport sensor histidine kinase DctB